MRLYKNRKVLFGTQRKLSHPNFMNLSTIGEFALIDRIKKCVTNPSKHVIIGIGDDAAVLDANNGHLNILTTDALLEGIHFDLSYITPHELGWRAMAANLSDIAAMGGEPLGATVAIGLPETTTVEDVEAVYRGMDAIASSHSCSIVGGDMTASRSGLVITITILGSVEPDRLARRSGARIGDLLCVTGDLGRSMAGLAVLRRYGRTYPCEFTPAVQKHLMPVPRLAAARRLGEVVHPHAMIDISDGLAAEVYHICSASGTGAILYEKEIPIAPVTAEIARQVHASAVEYALSGGEDFELLFALDPSGVERAISAVHELDIPCTVIGEVRSDVEGIDIIDTNSVRKRLTEKGYRHF